MLGNIFGFFVKNRKGARKVSSMQGCLKFKYAVGKSKKNEKSKMMEGEYEICTDLPSARARHLESDERDLSPVLITTARLVLENWTRTSMQPYATPSLHVFFLIGWS